MPPTDRAPAKTSRRVTRCARLALGILAVGLAAVVVAAGGDGAGEAPELERVADTRFSVTRGFYEEPFVVEISSATAGATLRYTLDGSEPTLEVGSTYTRPLAVRTTTVLRARAYREGMAPTDVDTQTYLFLERVIRQTGAGFPPHWGDLGDFGTEPGNHPPGNHPADYAMDPDIVDHPDYRDTIIDDLMAVPTLSVVADRDDLFSTEVLRTGPEGEVLETRGIYPVGKGFERPASVELLDPAGGRGFQVNCALEIQGASSTDRWKTDKLSMRLKFDSDYGPENLDHPLFGDDATDRIKNVILDSTNQQSWTHPVPEQQLRAQYIRDQLVGDFQNAAGGVAPHGKHYHVYLNGLYWGMYWLHEFADDHFAEAYLGGDNDDYDVLRHRPDKVVAGDNQAYLDLFAAADEDLADPAAYGVVAGLLDVPGFIDYMLVNFYAGNTDWAWQNWVASRSRVDPAGRWRYHNWDAERTFIWPDDDVTGRTGREKPEPDPSGTPTYLHHRLVENPEYRLLFADHAHRHCFNGGLLTPGRAAQVYLDRLGTTERAVVAESARWGDNRNPGSPPFNRNQTWVAERTRLLDAYFPGRTDTLLGQLRARGLYPATAAPLIDPHGGLFPAGAGVEVALTNPGGGGGEGRELWYTLDGTDPRLPGGAVAGGALRRQGGDGPLQLASSAVLKARVREADGGEWSALAEATFFSDAAASSLRVTEVMFNPGAASAEEAAAGFADNDVFEYLELANVGAAPVPLGGVSFSHGVRFVFPPLDLAPGARVVVAKSAAAFAARYGDLPVTLVGEFGGSLANAGERLALRGAFGEPLLDFSFSEAWDPAADGGGFSLVVVDPGQAESLWGLPAGWRRSARPGGSPGSADPPLPPLRIAEVMYHPADPGPEEDPDGVLDGDAFEYVEIVNAGGRAVPLAGVSLPGLVEFTSGEIGAGGRILVARDPEALEARYGAAAAAAVAGVYPDALDNKRGTLTLLGAGGEVIDSLDYEDGWHPVTDGEGPSLALRFESPPPAVPRGAADWRASTGALGSPGLAEPPEPPRLRITEIMFHPTPDEPDGEDAPYEYIELENTGAVLLELAGTTLATGDDEGGPTETVFTFGALSLGPGERLLLVNDEEAFAARYGGGLPVAGAYSGRLGNGGERLVLATVAGATILDFIYKDSWYPSTDGAGASLTLVDAAAHPARWGSKRNWRPSGAGGGTPGGGADPYAAWRWGRFPEEAYTDASAGAGADPDNDGFSNLLEYALGGDPLEVDIGALRPALSHLRVGPGRVRHLALSFPWNRAAADVVFRVEVSSDADTWLSGPPHTVEVSRIDLGDGADWITVRDALRAAGSPRRFLRLVVVR